MNTDELIALVRRNATIEDAHADYPDSVLLAELQDSLTTKFQRIVLDARNGYWLQHYDVVLSSGQTHVRMPARATALSKVEIGTGSGDAIDFTRIPRTQEGHADLFEGARSTVGRPQRYVTRGDKIALLPSADSSGYTLRVWYFIRPSRLVEPQPRGVVTAVNTAARTIAVNQIPWDQDTELGVVSGVDTIDVVHPDGWHELALVGASQTWSGATFSVGGNAPLDTIQVGDVVRKADQSEWPPLPRDFHRCLADITTTKVLLQMDFPAKAQMFAGDVTADLERFTTLISDRVKEEPRKVRAALPWLRRRV